MTNIIDSNTKGPIMDTNPIFDFALVIKDAPTYTIAHRVPEAAT